MIHRRKRRYHVHGDTYLGGHKPAVTARRRSCGRRLSSFEAYAPSRGGDRFFVRKIPDRSRWLAAGRFSTAKRRTTMDLVRPADFYWKTRAHVTFSLRTNDDDVRDEKKNQQKPSVCDKKIKKKKIKHSFWTVWKYIYLNILLCYDLPYHTPYESETGQRNPNDCY